MRKFLGLFLFTFCGYLSAQPYDDSQVTIILTCGDKSKLLSQEDNG
jgi:hypothetical protein